MFLILGFLEVSENIFTPKISGFTVCNLQWPKRSSIAVIYTSKTFAIQRHTIRLDDMQEPVLDDLGEALDHIPNVLFISSTCG